VSREIPAFDICALRAEVLRELDVGERSVRIVDLSRLDELTGGAVRRLPFALRIFLEGILRHLPCPTSPYRVESGTRADFASLAKAARRLLMYGLSAEAEGKKTAADSDDVSFYPARILLQDYTGVPLVADLAALRDAVAERGVDMLRVNPVLPVDLVIDHSVSVEVYGTPDALERNREIEFERNRERFRFLRWAQSSFANLRVVPPGSGIVHQVNLEYLARVVEVRGEDAPWAFFDTLVGTDSHTTMVNGLGVLGWGVGGIEAEAAMLGRPLVYRLPEVVGVELTGYLPEGRTATDLVLTLTHLFRRIGVVGKIIEFIGPGVRALTVADRATVSNMAPEYGATAALFPVDDATLRYLELTGRAPEHVALVRAYLEAQGMFGGASRGERRYALEFSFDIGSVEATVAGPKRPHETVVLREMQDAFRGALVCPQEADGYGKSGDEATREVALDLGGRSYALRHGSVVLAAITSCTNTSNPSLMLMAGLVAKKARAFGLRIPAYVKTSLSPGSQAVTRYLREAGLLSALEDLGFHVVGYGCMTCIGNSGPLPKPVERAIHEGDLVVASVLSGNRNFEGRIHPLVKANYLASPPLVVAFALAGRVDGDWTTEPLGFASDGRPVYLRDLWPSSEEVEDLLLRVVTPETFRVVYARIFEGDAHWQSLDVFRGARFVWAEDSTYIRRPPFFDELPPNAPPVEDVLRARTLLILGDYITTDHISPAGTIPTDSPAGRYLQERGVSPRDFGTYGTRRGNHEVMVRGTFAHPRLRNTLAGGKEGGITRHFPSGELLSVYEAAERYRAEGVPLLVFAGKAYGTGSSRDWAAKGTRLLGVRAVIAESFERIPRRHLVGMGILPLELPHTTTVSDLALTGAELFDLRGLTELEPFGTVELVVHRSDGTTDVYPLRARIDSAEELRDFREGGLLAAVVRELVRSTP